MFYKRIQTFTVCSVAVAALAFVNTSADAVTQFIPANTSFDSGPEGWSEPKSKFGISRNTCFLENTATDCRAGTLSTSYQPAGGDPNGFLRINNESLEAERANAQYGVSHAEWSSPNKQLQVAQNEEVTAAKILLSSRVEALLKRVAPEAYLDVTPKVDYKISLIDQTAGGITVFEDTRNIASVSFVQKASAAWARSTWQVDPKLLVSGHEYRIGFQADSTFPYQFELNYDLYVDIDNAKLEVTTAPKATLPQPNPAPTSGSTTSQGNPLVPSQDSGKGNDSEKGGAVSNQAESDSSSLADSGQGPLDLGLNRCGIVDVYGAMNSFKLSKTKTRIWVRRTATTQVTSKRNYYVWTEVVRNKKQIRRVVYQMNGKKLQTDKRRRAVLRLQDFQGLSAGKHHLVVTITPRRGKNKTVRLTVNIKPCTVLMQAGLKRGQLELRVADWYDMQKTQFSLPQGINVLNVRAKIRNALQLRIGKKNYRLSSLGKGLFGVSGKTLSGLRVKAKGRTITVTGLPAQTRDVRLLFKRSQKIVKIAWIKNRKRADTVLFKGRVTDKVAVRNVEYRAYNTNKLIK